MRVCSSLYLGDEDPPECICQWSINANHIKFNLILSKPDNFSLKVLAEFVWSHTIVNSSRCISTRVLNAFCLQMQIEMSCMKHISDTIIQWDIKWNQPLNEQENPEHVNRCNEYYCNYLLSTIETGIKKYEIIFHILRYKILYYSKALSIKAQKNHSRLQAIEVMASYKWRRIRTRISHFCKYKHKKRQVLEKYKIIEDQNQKRKPM